MPSGTDRRRQTRSELQALARDWDRLARLECRERRLKCEQLEAALADEIKARSLLRRYSARNIHRADVILVFVLAVLSIGLIVPDRALKWQAQIGLFTLAGVALRTARVVLKPEA